MRGGGFGAVYEGRRQRMRGRTAPSISRRTATFAAAIVVVFVCGNGYVSIWE
jgi:hypothetical protein